MPSLSSLRVKNKIYTFTSIKKCSLFSIELVLVLFPDLEHPQSVYTY